MAITPIDIFQQPQQSIVGRMLAGGVQVFGDAIASAVNIGRNLADHQERAEISFLGERRNEESLAQRRAENIVEQTNKDRAFAEGVRESDQRFDRGVLESDRGFDYRKAEDARDNARLTAAQVFSEKNAADRLAAEKDSSQLRRDEFDLKKGDLEAKRRFNQSIIAPDPEIAGPPAPGEVAPGITPEEMFGRGQNIEKAGYELNNAEAVNRGTAMQARAKAASGTKGTVGGAPLSPTEERMQRAEERRVALDEQKANDEAAKELIADLDAFQPQLSQQEMAAGGKSYKNPAAATEAGIFDKDRLASEKAVATSVKREEYIAKGEYVDPSDPKKSKLLTPAQKERRGKFWDLMNAKGESPAAAANPINDAIKTLLGK